jgi:hypothetical protein
MTEYPTTLCESDDFGGFTLIVSLEQFEGEIQNAIEAMGDNENFDPTHRDWMLVDPQEGIYECLLPFGTSRRAKMTWNEYIKSFVEEDIEL